MVATGGSTMIVSFGNWWLSTLLFPGILSTLASTRQPSLVRGQGQGRSAHSALGRITLRISAPWCHSSNPHHRHNHPGLDQLDHASPVQLEDRSHCSTFACPGTKGHVSTQEPSPINTYVPPANSGIERRTARIPLRGRHISPQGGGLSHCSLSLEIQEASHRLAFHFAVMTLL